MSNDRKSAISLFCLVAVFAVPMSGLAYDKASYGFAAGLAVIACVSGLTGLLTYLGDR